MTTIAIDYTPAVEQGGGIGRYVRELVAALSVVESAYHYRCLVANSSDSKVVQIPQKSTFTIRRTWLSSRNLARVWHRLHVPLPVECFVGRVNIFHATDFVLPPTLPSTRTLLTVHDLSFARLPHTAVSRLKVYLDRVVPASIHRADWVLADSEATRSDICDLYGVSRDRIFVLYSGVDVRFSVSNKNSLLTTRSHAMPLQRPYILAVGTVQPRKNYSRLVQALSILRGKGIDIQLVIAGARGWLEDEIHDTVAATGMSPHVHFIGFVDDGGLPALYRGAVCFAFPSLYEGFGLPLLEAMACGVPVLTSNVSSMPEIAGDAAVVVNPYDVEAIAHGLERLITDEELRKALKEKGLERAKQFTWEKSAVALLNIYTRLLDKPK